MNVQIAPPTALHEPGKRANNEDNLFPPFGSATEADRLFLVCDGVGGHEKGEVASEIACTAISGYYSQNGIFVSEDQTVNRAIAFAKEEISRFLTANPGSERMATTVTLLHLHENGATLAHIGDSRIYHVRNSEILWKTLDHSYVNSLVSAGLITETEAMSHPQRNVIMRALQGEDKEGMPDIHLISDIRAGDYFFLCTDGVLESLDDVNLVKILSGSSTDSTKMDLIKGRCQAGSHDNYTAYLIRIITAHNNVAGRVDNWRRHSYTNPS